MAEARPVEMRPSHLCAGEESASEVCISQDRLAQVGVAENRCSEVCSLEIRSHQNSLAQDGLSQTSSDQQRLTDICTAQIRDVQTRPSQVHPAKLCSFEVHSGEIGLDRVMLLP